MKKTTLPANLIVGYSDSRHLLHNLTLFARLLRQAGFAAGLDKQSDVALALCHLGIEKRQDVQDALASLFVEKQEQRKLFEQIFDLFWNERQYDDTNSEIPLEKSQSKKSLPIPFDSLQSTTTEEQEKPWVFHSAGLAQGLENKDFEKMNASEWQQANQLAQKLSIFLPPSRSHRRTHSLCGQTDVRRSVRQALARCGYDYKLYYTKKKTQKNTLVLLLDISGSMSVYTRTFIHFIAGACVNPYYFNTHVFLLGTKLTAIRWRQGISIEQGIEKIVQATNDWDGGTFLNVSLNQFNRQWRKRFPVNQTTILLATDGLERNCDEILFTTEMKRLQRSCKRLLWLNPLLRFDAYSPLAQGAKIIQRYSEKQYSIHNLRMLSQLSTILLHD